MSTDSPSARPNYVKLVVRESWSTLPLLLGVSVLCCVVAALSAYALPGVTPVGLLILGLVIVPLIATLVQVLQDSITPDAYGLAGYLRRFPRTMLRAGAVSSVPSFLGATTLVSLDALNETRNLFWLVPLGIGCATTVLAALAMIIAIPLRFVAPALRVRQLWAVSLAVVARAPVPVVAVVAIGVAGLWASLTFSAALIMVTPIALAVIWAAASLTSSTTAGIDLRPDIDESAER